MTAAERITSTKIWPYGHRLPARIRMHESAQVDQPTILGRDASQYLVMPGEEYPCDCTLAGEVSVLLPSGACLGVEPNSFDVVAWRSLPAN